MNKKHSGRYYIIFGIVWLITGIINILNSANYSFINSSMGITYIGIAVACMCLSIFYMSMGFKKKK